MELNDWFIDVADLKCVEILKAYDDVTIYKGLWRKHQTVCVKQIKIRTPTQAALIHREICILGMCVHPNVCQYLGSANDVDQNIIHIVFEYMERGNLDDYITSNSALTNREKLDILMAVAVGLEYLWLRKPCRIIHRDFKPSNILLNRHGDAKIADFGVSKWLASTTTTTFECSSAPSVTPSPSIYDVSHEGVGTVRWTAPELLCEHHYNHLCDVYSFGLVAFFVWTDGEVPYYNEHKNNGAQIAFSKSTNKRPFLNHPKMDHLESMRHLVERCTEKNIRQRPQSPGELIDMLDEIISNIDTNNTTEENTDNTFIISI